MIADKPDKPTLIPWIIVIALLSAQFLNVNLQSQWQTLSTQTRDKVSISLGEEPIIYQLFVVVNSRMNRGEEENKKLEKSGGLNDRIN